MNDKYSCLLEPSHEAMNNHARAIKPICFTLGTATTCLKPSNASFGVHVALVQYISGRYAYLLIFDVLARKTPE